MRKLLEVLERCHSHSLTINGEKSTLAAKEIEFVGYKNSPGKIKPDRRKVDSVECFPALTTRTELRSFMGLANQLGSFSSKYVMAAAPLRGLLK